MSIQFSKYRDIKCVKLSFNQYTATILYGRGCNIIEFNDHKKSITALHAATDEDMPDFQKSPQRYGSAPLFPPNKIQEGIFTRDGKTYDLPAHQIPFAHGLLKEFEYGVREWCETSNYLYIKFCFNSRDTAYYSAFQWDFDCNFEFKLSEDGLSQTISFYNHGTTEIPFGVGFHTSFHIPFEAESTPDDYLVFAGTGMQWELDEHSTPTGTLNPPARDYIKSGVKPINEPIADHMKVIPLNNDSLNIQNYRGTIIKNIKTGRKVKYEIDEKYTQWMFWNNKATTSYICLEPMTWIIDAPHTTYIPDKDSGYQYLKPGMRWSATNILSIE